MTNTFHPAKHCTWITRLAQWGNALDLFVHNRLQMSPRDLATLTTLPRQAGVILILNHADETDIRVCMEIARRAHRRFTYMINAEAFEECRGIAGWWLQRLGAFSVARGAADEASQRYAVELMKQAGQTLVMFPEGEIYYLNDFVQPFKTGAVRFGLQALTEPRATRPDWPVYLLPMAIKYQYRTTIEWLLHQRIRQLEHHLALRSRVTTLQQQLARIMAELLKRQQPPKSLRAHEQQLIDLSDRVREVRTTIVASLTSKYPQVSLDPGARLRDRAQRLIGFLQEQLRRKQFFSPATREQIQHDVQDLQRTIQMAGWHPPYTAHDPSEERLAETVMKLEREAFGTPRPRPLANRDVLVRIGTPLDLRSALTAYQEDASGTCRRIAEALRDEIQTLIESVGSR
jgi:hypothetical protein